MEENFNEVYKALIEWEFFTEDELNLVTNINGGTVEVLNDCIYARYGYRNFKQLTENM